MRVWTLVLVAFNSTADSEGSDVDKVRISVARLILRIVKVGRKSTCSDIFTRFSPFFRPGLTRLGRRALSRAGSRESRPRFARPTFARRSRRLPGLADVADFRPGRRRRSFGLRLFLKKYKNVVSGFFSRALYGHDASEDTRSCWAV